MPLKAERLIRRHCMQSRPGTRDSHVRAFVFHEMGNLSTGLVGVYDDLRESALQRRVPGGETLATFDTLLTSMRDVLVNFMGFTNLANAKLDKVPTEARACELPSAALSLSTRWPKIAE